MEEEVVEEQAKKPKSKARKIIEWVATAIIGVLFAFVAVCNVAKLLTRNEHYGQGNAFGFSNYVVLTDSMEPVYPVDSVIITYLEKPEEIKKQWDEIKGLNLESTDERCINLTFFDGYEKKEIVSPSPEYTTQTNPTGQVMTHQLFDIIVFDNIPEGEGKYKFYVHGINISEHQSGVGQYQVFTEKELLGVVKTNSRFLGAISGFISSVWGLLILLLIPCLYLVITSILDLFKAANMKDDEEEAVEASQGSTSVATMSEKDYESLKQQMIDEMLNGKKGKEK